MRPLRGQRRRTRLGLDSGHDMLGCFDLYTQFDKHFIRTFHSMSSWVVTPILIVRIIVILVSIFLRSPEPKGQFFPSKKINGMSKSI